MPDSLKLSPHKFGASMWILLKPHWARIFVVCILGLGASLAEGIGLTLFGPLLAVVTNQSGTNSSVVHQIIEKIAFWTPGQNRVTALLLSILFLAFVKNVFSYCSMLFSAGVEHEVGFRLRVRLFDKLLQANQSFYINNESGRIAETLSLEVSQAVHAVDWFNWLIIESCTVAVFVLLLLLLSPRLCIIVALGILGISGVLHFVMRRIKRHGREQSGATAGLTQRLLDAINGIRTVHAFCLEDRMRTAFQREARVARRTGLAMRAVGGASQRISELGYAVLLIAVLAVGLQDHANIPYTAVFLFILFRLQPHANELNRTRSELASLAASVDHVVASLNETGEQPISSGSLPFRRLTSEIVFRDVSVRHAGNDAPTLRHVSLSIPAGKVTAIVGPTGSGKTSIVNLLCRFRDPSSGEITVDGTPLSDFDLASWRGAIALAGQDMHLFCATVRENIEYGRLGATRDEILRAVQDACARGFIAALPQGFETPVGGQGARLSGGERQRIALARAFVRNAEILILDEATNALDSISEALVQNAITRLCKGRTVIVVAHRFSSVRNADHVIVLRDGEVIEQGSPNHLLNESGLFAELYRTQISESAL